MLSVQHECIKQTRPAIQSLSFQMQLNQSPLVQEVVFIAIWLYPDEQDQLPLRVNLHYFSKVGNILGTFLFVLTILETFSFCNQIGRLKQIFKTHMYTHIIKYAIIPILKRTYALSIQLNSLNFYFITACLRQCSEDGHIRMDNAKLWIPKGEVHSVS